MSTMGFITEQAPQGMGYALYSIALNDGKLDKHVIAFKTTMVEISIVRASLEKDAFGTESLPPIQKEVHYLERPQIPQRPQEHQNGYDPANPNGGYPHVPLSDRPNVVHKMEYPEPEGETSTLDKIKNAWPKTRTHANALAWFAILTVSYLGTRIA